MSPKDNGRSEIGDMSLGNFQSFTREERRKMRKREPRIFLKISEITADCMVMEIIDGRK